MSKESIIIIEQPFCTIWANISCEVAFSIQSDSTICPSFLNPVAFAPSVRDFKSYDGAIISKICLEITNSTF